MDQAVNDPRLPCRHPPGSFEKIEVLRRRRLLGLPLHLPGDAPGPVHGDYPPGQPPPPSTWEARHPRGYGEGNIRVYPDMDTIMNEYLPQTFREES